MPHPDQADVLAHEPPVVYVERISRPDSLRAVAGALETALWRQDADRPGVVRMTFTDDDARADEAGSREVYLDSRTLSLMSALLLCERYRYLPVAVTLPSAPSDLLVLARAGVLFACAQRPGPTLVDRAEEHGQGSFPGMEAHAALASWTGRWRPRDMQFRRRLMEQGASSPTADEELARETVREDGSALEAVQLVHDRFVTFLNPHRVPRGRVNAELTRNLVEPWLRRLLTPPSGWVPPGTLPAPELRLPALADYTRVVDELLDNLVDHAFGPTDLAMSYLQLFTTRGGTGSADRLHLSVLDNGRGIVSTLRPKVPSPPAGDDELLDELLHGRLRYGRGRGKGLAAVAAVAREHGGAALVATSAAGGGAWLAELRRDDEWSVKHVPWLPLDGTLAVLTLELDKATDGAQVQDDDDYGLLGDALQDAPLPAAGRRS